MISKQESAWTILSDAIFDSVFPGAVLGYSDLQSRWVTAVGYHSFEDDSVEMKSDSIFDVASVTKSIPVGSLGLKALEENRISLKDKLIQWLPEYSSSQRENVLIEHLFTHTLDFDFRLSQCKDLAPYEILQRIYEAPLKYPVGESYFYSNATTVLLGRVLENVYGETLDVLAKRYFFDPLNMNDTTFDCKSLSLDRVVPTEIDSWRGRPIHGEIHDESAFTMSKEFIAGSAGLFSTVPDLLNFMEMVISEGRFNDQDILSAQSILSMGTNHIPHLNGSAGLGWELNQPHYMGEKNSGTVIGKTGFTGCVVMADLEEKRSMVLLSNYTWPHRKENAQMIHRVRRSLAELLFEK